MNCFKQNTNDVPKTSCETGLSVIKKVQLNRKFVMKTGCVICIKA